MIRVEIKLHGGKVLQQDLDTFAERCLDGSDYDSGQIEALSSTTRKTCRAIGTLLSILREKELIGNKDIADVLGNPFNDKVYLFVPDSSDEY